MELLCHIFYLGISRSVCFIIQHSVCHIIVLSFIGSSSLFPAEETFLRRRFWAISLFIRLSITVVHFLY